MALAAGPECEPGGQRMASTHPVFSEAVLSQPSGHLKHDGALVVLEKVPARQAEHWWFCCTVGAEVIRRPCGHSVQVLQTDLPVAFW